MENNFGKNLKFLREKQGLEQIELAKLLNRKSSSSISEWEKGTYTPKSGVLSDIARIFNVNLQDLMNTDLTDLTSYKEVNPSTFKVPVYYNHIKETPYFAKENVKEYRFIFSEHNHGKNLFILEMKGLSMEPIIPVGSMVLIREQSIVKESEIAAIMELNSNEIILRRVFFQDKSIALMADNPNYPPIVILHDDDLLILGKAIEVTKKL